MKRREERAPVVERCPDGSVVGSRAPGPRRAWLAALAVALVCGLAGPAAAQVGNGAEDSPLPDPRKFARGLYAEAEVGSMVFLGGAGGQIGPGVAIGARVGYDLLRFVALQIYGGGSTHVMSVKDAPQSGQLLQIYAAAAELKLSLPLSQWTIAACGRGGLAALSTNILGTTGVDLTEPDRRSTPFFGGGAGVDYHTLSRHFSFGLHGSFVKLQKIFAPGALSMAAYVRYTF